MSAEWSEPQLQSLKRKIRERKSTRVAAEELSQEFGTHFSRNAVIGKCHRIGIDLGGGYSKPPPKPYKRREPRKTVLNGRAPVVSKPKTIKPPQPVCEPLPNAGTVEQLLALKSHHCRWIDNGSFCGQRVVHKSWCPKHFRRAFAR